MECRDGTPQMNDASGADSWTKLIDRRYLETAEG